MPDRLRKVAWSKQGVIATISSDGLSVSTHVLMLGKQNGSWHLSKPLTLQIAVDKEFPLVHASWSELGNELALVDRGGRITLWQNDRQVLGNMVCSRSAASDTPKRVLATVVALEWLQILPYAHQVNIPSTLQTSSVLTLNRVPLYGLLLVKVKAGITTLTVSFSLQDVEIPYQTAWHLWLLPGVAP